MLSFWDKFGDHLRYSVLTLVTTVSSGPIARRGNLMTDVTLVQNVKALKVQSEVAYPNFTHLNTSVILAHSAKPHPLFPGIFVNRKLFKWPNQVFQGSLYLLYGSRNLYEQARLHKSQYQNESLGSYIGSIQKFTFS